MNILFCNITYLKFYDGRVDGELKPSSGGRWVRENGDAHEKWNFLNYDGDCYGYVQINGEQLHIERYDNVISTQEEKSGMIIVWCAEHPVYGTVIVGWYENATIYRYCQSSISTPVTGIVRDYWFKTKAEDAYLLPEEKRTFNISRASKTGTGTGFGRGNIWYADSGYAKKNIIPNVLSFINENRKNRINTLTDEFKQPDELPMLSKEELSQYESFGEEVNLKTLNYAYREYANSPGPDAAYDVASSLLELCQFSLAIPWYEKVIEMDPSDFNTKGTLVYLYQQCKEYVKSIDLAEDMLNQADCKERDLIDELYCILADDYYFSNDISKAIEWLDRIIKESKNEELIQYTKDTKKKWMLC